MTLSRICNENLKGIEHSLAQPGRTHSVNGFPVEAVRKVGRHFQFLFSSYTGDAAWKTVHEDTNLVTTYSDSEYAAGIAAR
jgi:hypothetical protein